MSLEKKKHLAEKLKRNELFTIMILLFIIIRAISVGSSYNPFKSNYSKRSGVSIMKYTDDFDYPRFPIKSPNWEKMTLELEKQFRSLRTISRGFRTVNEFYWERVGYNSSGYRPKSAISPAQINEIIDVGGYIARIVPKSIEDNDKTSSLCFVSHLDSHYNTVGYSDNLLAVTHNMLLLHELLNYTELQTPLTVILTESEEQSLNSIWGLAQNAYVQKCGLSIVLEGMGCAKSKAILTGAKYSGKIFELAFKNQIDKVNSGCHSYVRSTPIIMDIARFTHGNSFTESYVLGDKQTGPCGEVCTAESTRLSNILEVVYVDDSFKYHTHYDDARCVEEGSVKSRFDMIVDIAKRIGKMDNDVYKSYINTTNMGVEATFVFDKWSFFMNSTTTQSLVIFNVVVPVVLIVLVHFMPPQEKAPGFRRESSALLNEETIKKIEKEEEKEKKENTKKEEKKNKKITTKNSNDSTTLNEEDDNDSKVIEKDSVKVIKFTILETICQYGTFIGGYILSYITLVGVYFIWYKLDPLQTMKAPVPLATILFLLPPMFVLSFAYKLIHFQNLSHINLELITYVDEVEYISLILETSALIGGLMWYFKFYTSSLIILPTAALSVVYATYVLSPVFPYFIFHLVGLIGTIVNLYTIIPCFLPLFLQYPRDRLILVIFLLPLIGFITFGPLFIGLLLKKSPPSSKEKTPYWKINLRRFLPAKILVVIFILLAIFTYTLPAFTQDHPFAIQPSIHRIINVNKSTNKMGLFITSASAKQTEYLSELDKFKKQYIDEKLNIYIDDLIYTPKCDFDEHNRPCYEVILKQKDKLYEVNFSPDFNDNVKLTLNSHTVISQRSISIFHLVILANNMNITGSKIIQLYIKSDDNIQVSVINGYNRREYYGNELSILIQSFLSHHLIEIQIMSKHGVYVDFTLKDVVRHNPEIIDKMMSIFGKSIAIFGKTNYIGPQAIITKVKYSL